jgi:hypothetical protein
VDLQGAAQAVVEQLLAAGVQATVDERDLNPPAVLVAVPLLSDRFGKGYWDAQFTLAAVVANSGRATALANLSTLLDQVAAAMGRAPVTARAIDLLVPDQGAPLPGYEMIYTQRIGE